MNISMETKFLSGLIRLDPADRGQISRWLGIPDRDYVRGESEIQHIFRLTIHAEQRNKISELLLKMEALPKLKSRFEEKAPEVIRNAKVLLKTHSGCGDIENLKLHTAKRKGVDLTMWQILQDIKNLEKELV